MSYDPIALRRAELQRQIAEAQRGLDTIQLVPTEDTYPDGAIIRAEIRFYGGDKFTYVFLKVGDFTKGDDIRWYHTGYIKHNSVATRQYFIGWRALQSWLIDRGRVVESWTQLRGAKPASGERVDVWLFTAPNKRTKQEAWYDPTRGGYVLDQLALPTEETR